jgi:uncharacterized damage-inducible protein DinB
MTLAEQIAAECKEESAKTRRFLERVPDDRFEWLPHKKSMSLRQLASHMAELPRLIGPIMNLSLLEFDPETYKPFSAVTRGDLLAEFDVNLAGGLKALEGRTDAHLAQVWRMMSRGQTLIEMPRSAALRFLVLNHTVHHRGQLGVYLRLLDLPVPAVYGPTADSTLPV